MADTMKGLKRTHYCGTVTPEMIGREVVVCGWAQKTRDMGTLVFIDLRDRTGIVQLAFDDKTDPALLAKAQKVRAEYVLMARGVLRQRESVNHEIPTGEVEVYVTELRVLAESNTPPFAISDDSRGVKEDLRLKYRYLDLRRPEMQNAIAMRHRIVKIARDYYDTNGFYEIETPILIKSTPEGARDYLVPSRVQQGRFYALPQSPQLYKQILMCSGFDRYMQIARCFRDEDLRADRQPEFTQIDVEMSFIDEEDIMAMNEGFMKRVFKEVLGKDLETPFRRIKYQDAMDNYGIDKPDTRFDLKLHDLSEILKNTEFSVFSGAIAGGIAKFINADEKTVEAVKSALSLEPNTLVFLSAGKREEAQKTAGVMRRMLGAACEGHMDKERYEFCWIVDFPMYEIGEESGELEFCHNPFSMPSGGMETLLKAERGEIDPLDILADQYDLVCNGVELSSGAVRNHDPEIMVKAFEMVRLGEDNVKAKFPAMYNAFCYGAPPHAGIAPGVDRMVMLLSGEESIREVIAFPMNKSAQDVMMDAPSKVTEAQLKELHIAVTEEE